jgi:hypothetical protein
VIGLMPVMLSLLFIVPADDLDLVLPGRRSHLALPVLLLQILVTRYKVLCRGCAQLSTIFDEVLTKLEPMLGERFRLALPSGQDEGAMHCLKARECRPFGSALPASAAAS